MISFVDVLPTLIELAGGKVPDGLDGRSFRQVLKDPTQSFRRYVFAAHTRDGNMNVFPQRCVRDSRYKYVLNLKPKNLWTTHFTKVEGIPDSHADVWNTWLAAAKTDPAAAATVALIEHRSHPAEELYDLDADPYEMKNLAAEPSMKPVRDRLRTRLHRWLTEQNDPEYDASAAP